MVRSIQIKNFRCFQDSHFQDFGRVNLISGKNNAGKTALLEAILLGTMPTPETVFFLQMVRNEDRRFYQISPESAWKYVFYNTNKKDEIHLNTKLHLDEIKVALTCKESFKDQHADAKNGSEAIVKVEDNVERVRMSDLVIKTKTKDQSVISQISYQPDGYVILEQEDKKFQPILFTYFLPTGFKKNNYALAKEFDIALTEGKKEKVLTALRIIDPTIKDAMTLSIGEPCIYLEHTTGILQPLNFYGDAINKVVNLVLRVILNPECIILIDEIENGIHHSNQEQFWSLLFKFTQEFKVQVFATTHSAEMITAFQKVGSTDLANNDLCYFEMFRSGRSGQITSNRISLDTLSYQLQNQQPFRGE
jgi:AAA15 family ATPase/GTPase